MRRQGAVRLLVLFLLAVGVVALRVATGSARTPIRFWLREFGDDVDVFDAPEGHALRGWRAKFRMGRRGRAEVSLRRDPSLLDDVLRRLGVTRRDDAATAKFEAYAGKWNGERWAEVVQVGLRVPSDAVADPDLVGSWGERYESGALAFTWELEPGGVLRGNPIVGGMGRWGRIGEFLYFEWPYLPEYPQLNLYSTDLRFLDPSGVSWRGPGGVTATRSRPSER